LFYLLAKTIGMSIIDLTMSKKSVVVTQHLVVVVVFCLDVKEITYQLPGLP